MKHIIVNGLHYSEIIKLDEIVYCQAEGSYTKIILKDKRTIISSKNLLWFERIIGTGTFARLHRSYFVNLEHVTKILNLERKVMLYNETTVPLSRYKIKEFRELLSQLNQYH